MNSLLTPDRSLVSSEEKVSLFIEADEEDHVEDRKTRNIQELMVEDQPDAIARNENSKSHQDESVVYLASDQRVGVQSGQSAA